MRNIALLVLGIFAGCAGAKGGICDPNTGHCPCSGPTCDLGGDDLSAAAPDLFGFDAGPDLTTGNKKFGDPCTDSNECASQICVFSGQGGVCTQDCPAIGCPAGYGCYGVLGAGIDPGTVYSVCVPENNLICTPCSKDSECGSPLGKDHCLPYPTGSFCGRDCSTVSCPPTYSCKSVGPDGGIAMQCVPNNNSCDCSPVNTGLTIACSLMSPTGASCTGTQKCNGAQGWGACMPPTGPDLPDDTFTDSNCDGIDGDVSHAIFVDELAGNDNFVGSMAKPVATIGKGLTLAKAQGKDVYVSKGTYPPVTLVAGVNLYGGYDASNNWQRSNTNTTTISGGNPSVEATSINLETHLVLFTVIANDAAGGLGQSSYGMRVFNSSGPIYVHGCTVQAGHSTGGNTTVTNGSKGGNGGKGGTGGNGCENCSSPSASGTAGTSSCNAGGTGGGGTSGSGSANPGVMGSGPSGGGPGSAGCGCDKNATLCATTCSCGGRCSPMGGGTGGSGGNGTNGPAANAIGAVSGNVFLPAGGHDGVIGNDGSGGGGGGGGGGSNGPCFCNAYTGGGGGGGGGAGCGGTPGAGGSGGGGSFSIFVFSSTVHVESCTLVSQDGGNGGSGGNGGLGGSLGAAGDPGSPSTDGEQGASGGPGGAGGAGGSASGGSGGPSLSIYSKSGTIFDVGNTFQNGMGGRPGTGGTNTTLGKAPDGTAGPTGKYLEN